MSGHVGAGGGAGGPEKGRVNRRPPRGGAACAESGVGRPPPGFREQEAGAPGTPSPFPAARRETPSVSEGTGQVQGPSGEGLKGEEEQVQVGV